MGTGDITLSGGGLTSVGTDEMLEHTRSLSVLARRLDNSVATLLSPATLPSGGRYSPQWRAGDPEVHLLWAGTALRDAHEAAAHLAVALEDAAEGYGRTERAVQRLSTVGSAVLGWVFGFASPVEFLALVVAALGAAAGFAAMTLVTGSPRASVETLALAVRRSGLLSNPVFVAAVRAAVSSVDDAMLGAARLPLPLTLTLDDDATGWFGLHGAAGVVVGLAGPRLLKETLVAVAQTGSATARGPTGFADLAARIPPAGVGKPQVRIERYEGFDGSPRWIVYAGGTVDTGLSPAGEPWDDTSNVQGIAQLDPGSVRATLAALREAGARPGDAVLSVGYSQGGIVATDVVREGGFTNAGLVTFGSPTGQLAVPTAAPDVAVEISEDLIPALGGEPRDSAHGGLERVLVRRGIYDLEGAADRHPPPTGDMLPAHALSNYADTARLMDASTDPRLAGMRERIDAFTGAAPPQVSLWRADRVSAASGPASGPAASPTAGPVGGSAAAAPTAGSAAGETAR